MALASTPPQDAPAAGFPCRAAAPSGAVAAGRPPPPSVSYPSDSSSSVVSPSEVSRTPPEVSSAPTPEGSSAAAAPGRAAAARRARGGIVFSGAGDAGQAEELKYRGGGAGAREARDETTDRIASADNDPGDQNELSRREEPARLHAAGADAQRVVSTCGCG
eukprot:scaffold3806_cov94-Isochrysis_galbana.AAC.11